METAGIRKSPPKQFPRLTEEEVTVGMASFSVSVRWDDDEQLPVVLAHPFAVDVQRWRAAEQGWAGSSAAFVGGV